MYVITRMLRSGKFVPSADWVIPVKGNGMELDRAEVAWKVLIDPQNTSMVNTEFLFTKPTGVLYNKEKEPWRYFNYRDRDLQVLLDQDQEELSRPLPAANANRANVEPDLHFLEVPEAHSQSSSENRSPILMILGLFWQAQPALDRHRLITHNHPLHTSVIAFLLRIPG